MVGVGAKEKGQRCREREAGKKKGEKEKGRE